MKGVYQSHKRLAQLACVLFLLCALVFVLMSCASSSNGPNNPAPGSTNPGNPRNNSPEVLQVSAPGEDVVEDAKAIMDYSNISDGYIMVRSTLGNVKVKVLVTVDGKVYQYTIAGTDQYVTIPLTEGSNKTYSIGVWENLYGDMYSLIFSQDISVALSDSFSPSLYPSQYVNFTAGDSAMQLSQTLTNGVTSELEAINAIYTWVIKNITYDTDKALTVASGYLPNNANTISTKTGICFDYAVLTVSMLRAQRIPAKLVVGYAGTAYHAWIEVYSTETGKIHIYTFNGNAWVREVDPTFDAAGGRNDLASIIGGGTNYQPMFYY